jgi:hypothetical protein
VTRACADFKCNFPQAEIYSLDFVANIISSLEMGCCDNNQLCNYFSTREELQKDEVWNPYFESVYGVSTMNFPFTMQSLNYFHYNLLNSEVLSNLTIRPQDITANSSLRPIDGKGPLCFGELYRLWGGELPADVTKLDIWRCIYPVGNAEGVINCALSYGFPSGSKVEVFHSQGDPPNAGMWFYFAAGSGIYFDIGKTVVFEDHTDCCSAWGLAPENLASMALEAVKRGYNTIQYTHRKEGIFKYEICAVKIDGVLGCFSQQYDGLFTSGWKGTRPCYCQPGYNINCKGASGAHGARGPAPTPPGNGFKWWWVILLSIGVLCIALIALKTSTNHAKPIRRQYDVDEMLSNANQA